MELRLIDAAWLSNLLVRLLCSLKYYSKKIFMTRTASHNLKKFLTSQEILSMLLILSLGLKKIYLQTWEDNKTIIDLWESGPNLVAHVCITLKILLSVAATNLCGGQSSLKMTPFD